MALKAHWPLNPLSGFKKGNINYEDFTLKYPFTSSSDYPSGWGLWGGYEENGIIAEQGPFGEDLVFATLGNDRDLGGSDGGFSTPKIEIDVDKSYRYSVWQKKKNITIKNEPIMDSMKCWLDGRDLINNVQEWKDRTENVQTIELNGKIDTSNHCALFDGIDDFISIKNLYTSEIHNTTLEFTVKIENHTSSYPTLFGHKSQVQDSGYIWISKKTDTNELFAQIDKQANAITQVTDNKIITYTFVASNDSTIKIYQDGILVETKDVLSTKVSPYSTSYIGRYGGALSNYQFKGSLYSFKMYDKALTDEEVLINSRYENLVYRDPLSISGLECWFDGSTGKASEQIWKDLSENNNDANMTNFLFDENSGWTGTSLKFSKNDSTYCSLPDSIIDTSKPFSFEVHYKPYTSYVWGGLITKEKHTQNEGVALNTGVLYHTGPGPTLDGYTNPIDNLTIRTQTVTYDGSYIRLYINGIEIYDYKYSMNNSVTPVLIGVRHANNDTIPSPGDYLDGEIYSARIYSKALSYSEIKSNYTYEKNIKREEVTFAAENEEELNEDTVKEVDISYYESDEDSVKNFGRIYFGAYAYDNTNAQTNVKYIDTDTLTKNPYFNSNRNSFSSDGDNKYFNEDEWYLNVGYIYKKDFVYGTDIRYDGGFYDITGKKVKLTDNDYQWTDGATKALLRAFNYDSTGEVYSGTDQSFWYRPRIDLLDGTEPSLGDLIYGKENPILIDGLYQDISGNNLMLDQDINTVKSTDGKIGNSYQFTSSDLSRLCYKDIFVGETLDDFTISLWTKIENKDNDMSCWVSVPTNNGDNIFGFLYRGSTNAVQFQINGATFPISGTNMDSYENQWVHVVGRRTGTSLEVFLNGASFGTPNTSANSTIDFGTSNNLSIGSGQDGIDVGYSTTQTLEGKMNDLRIYDTSLSDDEIAELYSSSTKLLDIKFDKIIDYKNQWCNPRGANDRSTGTFFGTEPGPFEDSPTVEDQTCPIGDGYVVYVNSDLQPGANSAYGSISVNMTSTETIYLTFWAKWNTKMRIRTLIINPGDNYENINDESAEGEKTADEEITWLLDPTPNINVWQEYKLEVKATAYSTLYARILYLSYSGSVSGAEAYISPILITRDIDRVEFTDEKIIYELDDNSDYSNNIKASGLFPIQKEGFYDFSNKGRLEKDIVLSDEELTINLWCKFNADDSNIKRSQPLVSQKFDKSIKIMFDRDHGMANNTYKNWYGNGSFNVDLSSIEVDSINKILCYGSCRVFVDDANAHLTHFERSTTNGDKGIAGQYIYPIGSTWKKGWNECRFEITAIDEPGLTDWSNIPYIDIYRSGDPILPDADIGKRISLQDFKLNRYPDTTNFTNGFEFYVDNFNNLVLEINGVLNSVKANINTKDDSLRYDISDIYTEWHMYSCSYNSTTGKMAILVDGVEVATKNITPQKIILASEPLIIGSKDNDFYLNGLVSNVKIWASEIASSDLLNIYNSEIKELMINNDKNHLQMKFSLNNTLEDSSGNNFTLSTCKAGSGPIVQNGKLGKSYSYYTDSTNYGYHYTKYQDRIDLTKGFALAFWITIDTTTTGATRMGVFETAYGAEFAINIGYQSDGSDDIQWYSGSSGISGGHYESLSTNFRNSSDPLGEWHHIVILYDTTVPGANGFGKKRIYVDGNQSASLDVRYKIVKASDDRFDIGRAYTGSFGGRLNDVRLYDTTISEYTIKELYQAKVLDYDFNKKSEYTLNLAANIVNKRANLSGSYAVENIEGGYHFITNNFIGTGTEGGWAYNHIHVSSPYTIPVGTWSFKTMIKVSNTNSSADIGKLRVSPYYGYSGDNNYNTNGQITYIPLTTFPLNEWHELEEHYLTVTDSDITNANRLSTFQKDTNQNAYDFSGISVEFYVQIEQKNMYTTDFTSYERTAMIEDKSEYNNNAILDVNSPRWIDGTYSFNGIDNYFKTPVLFDRSESFSNDFTISIWVYPIADGQIIAPNSAGIDHMLSYVLSNEQIKVGITEFSDVNNRGRLSTINSVPANTWTYIAITINKLDIKIYINGLLDSQYTEVIPIAEWLGYWRIGSRPNNTSYFNGMLDEFKVYATTLSDTDILEIYNQGR